MKCAYPPCKSTAFGEIFCGKHYSMLPRDKRTVPVDEAIRLIASYLRAKAYRKRLGGA